MSRQASMSRLGLDSESLMHIPVQPKQIMFNKSGCHAWTFYQLSKNLQILF